MPLFSILCCSAGFLPHLWHFGRAHIFEVVATTSRSLYSTERKKTREMAGGEAVAIDANGQNPEVKGSIYEAMALEDEPT
jgi:hypothetical protein